MIHRASAFQLCPCGQVHRELVAAPDPAAWRREFKGFFMANALKHIALSAMTAAMAYSTAHSAYSTTGANEVASARFANTWASPSSGAIALAPTLPSIPVPGGNTANWVGFFSASTAGTFYGMVPCAAETLKPAMCEAADVTSDTIFCDTHGYTANQRVAFWPSSGVALPGGLTVGTIYFVIGSPTTDSFQVSTTLGGSAVNITDPGTASPFGFLVQRCTPEVFGSDGNLLIGSGSLDLAALL